MRNCYTTSAYHGNVSQLFRRMSKERKIVFISYSWDSQDHQEWVLNLAKDLIEKFGIDVILDQYELSAGKDLTYFMESSIEKADKVLVILTPNYKLKAENRESGVGYETSMISQEIFESPISTVKFIPILRNGKQSHSSPKFLRSKLYHLMNDDEKYINQLYELSRVIYDKSLIEKPILGEIPDFDKKNFDPIIDIGRAFANEAQINHELNEILYSEKGVKIFQDETVIIYNSLKEKVEIYRYGTTIPFGWEGYSSNETVIGALGYSVYFSWALAFGNTTKGAILRAEYWNGIIRLHDGMHYFPGKEPEMAERHDYSMDLDYDKNIIWKTNSVRLSTNEVIQKAFLFLIESIRTEKSKNFRK